MNQKTSLVIALLALLSLFVAGCGKEEAPVEEAPKGAAKGTMKTMGAGGGAPAPAKPANSAVQAD